MARSAFDSGRLRTVAKAGVPSASGISRTPAAVPSVVNGCTGPSTSMRLRPIRDGPSGTAVNGRTILAVDRCESNSGDDDAVRTGDEHLAAGDAPPKRQHGFEFGLQTAVGTACLLTLESFKTIREQVARRIDLFDQFGNGLATMIEHLHDRTDADGEKKCDDQRRDGATQSRLGGQQPPISGLRNRLRQSLD